METKYRNFTVKSAYRVAVRMAKPFGGEHSLAGQDRKLWTKLWALNTPPKHDEMTVHILWECPLARNVWAPVRGKLHKCSANASNFYLLIRHLVDRLDRKELETWVMLSLALCNARSRYHFESLQSHPTTILQGATSLLDDYQ
uniref:Reverse transcriptase zinc-binding domain-containing protein n=1 Tax=Quercus lobata TaxID=97700 RepID=A0A7N2KTY1_QUELO